MNISDILNPEDTVRRTPCFTSVEARLTSPPLSPKSLTSETSSNSDTTTFEQRLVHVHGKPRSRFSDVEDAIICEGVAKGLTWGQISRQLPHRKRATCFNRYRTLQGIRKSRKRLVDDKRCSLTPPSPETPHSASLASPPFEPSTPASSSSLDLASGFRSQQLPSPRQILHIKDIEVPVSLHQHHQESHLPPLVIPTARYASSS
ncbi:hypothetical protein BX666DRAFT_2111135 [Dichotomocladium elegans]|nr:hypothetical protein BX666DRAFT_2111135 [Dichotomocladium elegans]